MVLGIDGVGVAAGTTPAARPEVGVAEGADGIGLRSGSEPSLDGMGGMHETLQLESSRRAFAETLREEAWETEVRTRLEEGLHVPDEQRTAYRERRFQKLMVFQARLHEIQFEMEFASKLAEHTASAGKTVLQTQL